MQADGAPVAASIQGKTSGLHALVIPYPARGHNLVAVQLSRKLVPYGVSVTIVNIFSNLSKDLLDACSREVIMVVDLGTRPADAGVSNFPFFTAVESLEIELNELVKKLNSETESPPVTCIVSDLFLGWTQNVADKFGIPRFGLCASPAKVLAVCMYMPVLAAQGIVPVEPSKVSKLVEIPGVQPTFCGDLSPSVQTALGLQFYEQYVYRNCQPAQEAAGWFVNSFYELESSCIDVLNSYPYKRARPKDNIVRSIFPVGPLVHDAYLQLSSRDTGTSCNFSEPEAAYIKWLNKQSNDSVLFVSFGSVVSLSIQQIHELVLGLEASNQRFLLVLRPSTLKNTHEGLPLLPENFKAHIEGTGFVQLDWISQIDVLSHSAVGGFLTHCGWNSTLESICRGVPLLAWPFQADQKLNCRFLVDEARSAIEVHRGPTGWVSKAELVRAVRQIMVEPEGQAIRENIGKLRDKVKRAVSKDGSVQASVEKFVVELRSCSTLKKNGL